MGLFSSSPCLGIDLCRMSLFIAPGCVHPKQWKAASTVDAGLVLVLSFMGGKSLCSVSYLLELLIIKEKIRFHILYCGKGLQKRGWWGRYPQKCIISVILCNVALGVVKSLSSLRATICVFELRVFWGGWEKDQETSYTIIKSKETTITADGLKPGLAYVFQIRARTAAGYGGFSRRFEFETSPVCKSF